MCTELDETQLLARATTAPATGITPRCGLGHADPRALRSRRHGPSAA